jgi:hypothetical protein
VSFLREEAAIEGDGVCRGLRKRGGVTGCVVTPLTMGTAPLLLYLAMGSGGSPVYISETKNLYQYHLDLLPTEDTECFDVIQDRGINNNEQVTINKERTFYEHCRVQGFELRIMRDEAIKLKLEICGESAPRVYPYTDIAEREVEERFKGEGVVYAINGQEYTNIYGMTLVSKKQSGTVTELLIKRALQQGNEIPAIIEELIITAQLLRTQYENRYFGMFRITIKRLVLICDETEVNTSGAVISPLRYYVAGTVSTEVFNSSGEAIP